MDEQGFAAALAITYISIVTLTLAYQGVAAFRDIQREKLREAVRNREVRKALMERAVELRKLSKGRIIHHVDRIY